MKDDTRLLKAGLVISIVLGLVYGLGFLVAPGLLVSLAGAADTLEPGWVRWAGATLLALCVGDVLVLRNVAGQDTYVFTLILIHVFEVLAQLLVLVEGGFSGATWFVVLPMVLLFLNACLLWIGRQRARGIL